MERRGWGKARGKDGPPAVVKPPEPKAGFMRQALNTPSVHRTSTTALNMPTTQRTRWQKLG